jgi:hypothetical protein
MSNLTGVVNQLTSAYANLIYNSRVGENPLGQRIVALVHTVAAMIFSLIQVPLYLALGSLLLVTSLLSFDKTIINGNILSTANASVYGQYKNAVKSILAIPVLAYAIFHRLVSPKA